eukprot:403364831
MIKERLGVNNLDDLIIQSPSPDWPALFFKDLFSFEKVIGQGAFGIVFQAERLNPPITASNLNISQFDINQYKQAAIKVINKKELSSDGYQVLKNEALILQSMDHPNIVKFYNTASFIFIEMEIIKGGTLKQLMKQRKHFSDLDASVIIKGLLSAVEHVHQKNFVHRDLKPDNILIADPNDLTTVKLADFGLSASFRLNVAYSLNERMGTLLYMAPEQTKNHSYGKRIDVWACGIVMYMLIDGKHPLYNKKKDDQESFIEKLRNPKFVCNDKFTPLAKDLFLKLCNPLPIERYTSDKGLKHPWITRDFNAAIPQTQSEQIREFQIESKLRNSVNILSFGSMIFMQARERSLNQNQMQTYLLRCKKIVEDQGQEQSNIVQVKRARIMKQVTQPLIQEAQIKVGKINEGSNSPSKVLQSTEESNSPPVRIRGVKKTPQRNQSKQNLQTDFNVDLNTGVSRKSDLQRKNTIFNFLNQNQSQYEITSNFRGSEKQKSSNDNLNDSESEVKPFQKKTMQVLEIDKGFTKGKIEKILDNIQISASPNKIQRVAKPRLAYSTSKNLAGSISCITHEEEEKSFTEIFNSLKEKAVRQNSQTKQSMATPSLTVKHALRSSQTRLFPIDIEHESISLPYLKNDNNYEVNSNTNRRQVPAQDWSKIIDGPQKRKSLIRAYATSQTEVHVTQRQQIFENLKFQFIFIRESSQVNKSFTIEQKIFIDTANHHDMIENKSSLFSPPQPCSTKVRHLSSLTPNIDRQFYNSNINVSNTTTSSGIHNKGSNLHFNFKEHVVNHMKQLTQQPNVLIHKANITPSLNYPGDKKMSPSQLNFLIKTQKQKIQNPMMVTGSKQINPQALADQSQLWPILNWSTPY